MAGSHEFSLEDLEPIPADTPVTPAPVVVIQYRRSRWSSLLVPPALILALAGVALVYRVHLADWAGVRIPSVLPASRLVAARVQNAPAATPAEPLPKLVINVAPAASAAEPSAPDPYAELALAGPVPEVSLRKSKEKANPGGAIGFDLPAPEPAAVVPRAVQAAPGNIPPQPDQDAGALTKNALDDIRAQAKRAKEERAALEDVKEHGLELERRRLVQKQRDKIAQMRRDADAGRRDFLDVVQGLLRRTDRRAGVEIHRFMQEELAGIDPTLSEPLSQAIDRTPYQTDIARRILDLRKQGVPEALILKFVWKNEIRNIPARKGPRDEAEAMVFAARRLVKAAPASSRRALAESGATKPTSSAGGDRQRTAQ